MQMEKRPKIKITIIDRKGPKGCHRGHKVGDTFDFDTERGKICPMAMHVLFPEIDILRYGGEVPGQEKGTAVVACPDADTLTVFKVERIESQQVKLDFNKLLKQIFDYDPDGPNIHHLMAVHGYSRMIAQLFLNLSFSPPLRILSHLNFFKQWVMSIFCKFFVVNSYSKMM